MCGKIEENLLKQRGERTLNLTAETSMFFFCFFEYFLSHQNHSSSDWILVNWQEMKKTEWLLRGVIKNTSIVSICYNAHFIPDFQCLLQAFSQCVSWRHSKPEALGIMKLFS